jgi:peptide/nickel transport system permease protein
MTATSDVAGPQGQLVDDQATGGGGGYARNALRIVGLHLITLFLVVTAVFLLPRAMPGDPLLALTDPSNPVYLTDPEIRARVMAYYGLDRPLVAQYGTYLGRVVRGDLGWSIGFNVPTWELIRQHLPWTLLLAGVALVASALLSFTAGIAAAWRRGSKREKVLITGMTALRAVPEYALASALLILFAVLAPVFPLSGARTPFAQHATWFAGAWDIVRHLALPALALTLGLIGNKFLVMRNTAITVLGEDYMLLARAKGLTDRTLKYHHVGRNALLPFLTVVGLQVGFAVGGAVFVESVFAYPGMGTLILRSVAARDYPVLEGVFLVLAATVLLVNLLLEIVYARLDPRVRAQ